MLSLSVADPHYIPHVSAKAASTHIHGFICNKVDCGNAINADLLSQFNQLLSFLNSAAWLLGGIPNYGHISTYMQDELHEDALSVRS